MTAVKTQRIINVVDYNPNWPSDFQEEAEAITNTLGAEVIDIHHIGSTAVPGLKAKPIIDIILEVGCVERLDQHNAVMESIGYIPKGEFGIAGRRFYLKGVYSRTHHIHAFQANSLNVKRHLAVRDYLISHPHVAKEYGLLKVRCAEECGNDSNRYSAGKNAFVSACEQQALEWSIQNPTRL